MLGHALLQHQHIGILPTSADPPSIRPLQDPSTSTTMPEAWVRYALIESDDLLHIINLKSIGSAAILIRMNSLIRGHSGIRLVVKLVQ